MGFGTAAKSSGERKHLAGFEVPGRFYNTEFGGVDRLSLLYLASPNKIKACSSGLGLFLNLAPQTRFPIYFVVPEGDGDTSNLDEIRRLADNYEHVTLLTVSGVERANGLLSRYPGVMFLGRGDTVEFHPTAPYLLKPEDLTKAYQLGIHRDLAGLEADVRKYVSGVKLSVRSDGYNHDFA